ncbi:glutathione peroxidase [Cohnella sp. REN36]|uniref:glutathione peroxidase n=1 Tax=Cohnella sp. REN36 TaxID=2887347 RepID=UPI001D153D41|nr:glutathione peroxidase [Cohnella sp. REN36]MCC3373445.1 glutathione peroxidase [Cohnella sp. REN36]
MSVYDYSARSIKGEPVSLSAYRGKVLVIVNTASKCGFTPQYEGLEALYQQYRDQGLEILGFPCDQFGGQEPGSDAEVEAFCKLNYGVTFPLFEKTLVRGPEAAPLFHYLTDQAPFEGFDTQTPGGAKMQAFLQEKLPEYYEGDGIKWNFTKFLVDREGRVVGRFESTVDPASLSSRIEALL